MKDLYYEIEVAGLKRQLPICPLNDKLCIAGFVIFGDVELTVNSARELLKIAPETPYAELQPLQELTDTTLVTRFDSPGKPTHLMVVNCDYRKDRTLHIKAPSDAERFDALAGKWSPVGAEFDLSLVRGGGVLLRLTK